MTDIKISELSAAVHANPDDLLEASQVSGPGYVTRRVTLDQVSALVADSDQLGNAIDAAIDALPTTLPPSGPAGGALTGTYPNPTLLGGPLTNYLTTAAAATTYQPLDADLTALAGLNATAGLVEQTAAAAFTKRLIGVANATDVLTRAGGDARYGALSGSLLQTVSTQTGAVATGTTVIPFDDTIPQITEGNEHMTLAVTPKSATSKLIIDVVWNGAHSTNQVSLIVALFQDSSANALAVVASSLIPTNNDNVQNIKLTHTMTSGTTSATTFRVRAGGHIAGTTTFNGFAGARKFGGAYASSIVIRESAP